MKRTNEFAVGLAVLLALALVVAGALWLSETDVEQEADRRRGAVPDRGRARRGRAGHAAGREGRPGRGDPAGPGRVGRDRVQHRPGRGAARQARGHLRLRRACSASGAPTSSPTSRPPTDPNLRDALAESDRAGGDAWPGATLPDIGQLTAQASRIAGDVGVVTQRISQAFDSTALKNLQKSVKDLAEISGRLVDVRQRADRPASTA